jgi:nitrate reductase gamma subunit
MTAVTYVAVYASLVVFAAGSLWRILQYSRTPLHLRWELYPVPHEEPSRAAHGGSYFENSDWYNHSHKFNMRGELGAMLPEMLFLKGLWESNRGLWFTSFPFHFGLYLSITTTVLLGLTAGLRQAAPGLATGALGTLLVLAYHATGYIGTALVLVGALGLLLRRLTDAKLKNYTSGADIFNLLFFIVAFGTMAAGYLLQRPAGGIVGLVLGLFTYNTSIVMSPVLSAGVVLTGLLLAYIPYTHMSHFIGKYFTYHAVRWDDAANRRGGKIEAKIAEYLTYKPTWAAPHVHADGKRTWAEVATINPTQEVRK